MVTYYISPRCVVMLVSRDEVFVARELVSCCLKIKARRIWRDMEIDLFRLSAGETMLIARPGSPKRRRVSTTTPRIHRRQ